MNDFLRPSFWDIVGVILGLAGLWLGGVVIVELRPGGWEVAGLITAFGLVILGVFAAQHYVFTASFPFSGVRHKIRLTFVEEQIAGRSVIRAQLIRKTYFTPKSDNLTLYDRHQLVPDGSSRTPEEVKGAMGHDYSVHVLKRKLLPGWLGGREQKKRELNGVNLVPKFPDNRQLRLDFVFPDDMKRSGGRFRIKETLNLPNDFSQPNEYYSFEVSEPALSREFDFIFPKHQITSASYTIVHGSMRSKPKAVQVRDEGDGSRFGMRITNASVGSKILFEWNWRGMA